MHLIYCHKYMGTLFCFRKCVMNSNLHRESGTGTKLISFLYYLINCRVILVPKWWTKTDIYQGLLRACIRDLYKKKFIYKKNTNHLPLCMYQGPQPARNAIQKFFSFYSTSWFTTGSLYYAAYFSLSYEAYFTNVYRNLLHRRLQGADVTSLTRSLLHAQTHGQGGVY